MTTAAAPAFVDGDLVWYHYTMRAGYGYVVKVPAIYRGATAKRARIEVLKRDGTRAIVCVLPTSISPRGADEAIVWT